MGLLQPQPQRLDPRLLRPPSATGKTHYKALRALANHWLELLWHLPHKRALYNESTHQHNRSKAEATACAA